MAKHKTSNQCKLCRSHLRQEVETRRIIHASSLRDLEDYCKDNGLEISYGSIKRHFGDHVDEKREVQIRYFHKCTQEKAMNTAGDEVAVKLKELNNIDSAIKEATDLMLAASLEVKRQLDIKLPRSYKEKDENGKETGKKIRYETVNVSHSIVQLFKGATEEIRQCVKSKLEILGIDKKAKATKDDAVDSFVDAIMRLEEE